MPVAPFIAPTIAVGGVLLTYFSQQQALEAQKQANADSLQAAKDEAAAKIKLAQDMQTQNRADAKPFVDQGAKGMDMLSTLSGANGPEAQAAALQQFQNDPTMMALIKQSQRGVAAGAAATGTLRSGSTQSALAQVGPSILQSALAQRIAQLNGLANIGQNAVSGLQQSTSNAAGLQASALSGQGAAQDKFNQNAGELNSVNPLLNAMGYGLGYASSPSGMDFFKSIK